MSNILNKSNHPIEIKRVELSIWKLRDEIESAIERRMSEREDGDQAPVDITDIKEFYLSVLNADGASSESDEESAETDDNLDSSGNPLDDDAKAMLEALGGGATDEEAPAAEEVPPEEEAPEAAAENSDGEKPAAEEEENQSEEDDEAAMMAAAMLGDQGMGEPAAEEVIQAVKKKFERMPPHERKIVKGFVLLSDIQMDQIMIFSKNNFIHGQDIIIKFLVPKPFIQSAEIMASTNISRNSKIISAVKPDFRLQSLFTFKFPGERTNLRNFLKSVEPDIPDPPKKLKRPDGDDDDDFDDLGF